MFTQLSCSFRKRTELWDFRFFEFEVKVEPISSACQTWRPTHSVHLLAKFASCFKRPNKEEDALGLISQQIIWLTEPIWQLIKRLFASKASLDLRVLMASAYYEPSPSELYALDDEDLAIMLQVSGQRWLASIS